MDNKGAAKLTGDFRAPNIMRFGFTPLYLDRGDIDRAVEIAGEVMRDRDYERAEFQAKSAVT